MTAARRFTDRPSSRHAPALAIAFAMALASIVPSTLRDARAAPGAHGPNGEHLDEKAVAVAGQARPRLEAHSELFELVARLEGGALTVLVDRYETNEPVLGAALEAETGSLKAAAAFRTESGDYAVTDAGMLKALSEPGEHALVFTLVAGADSDLLDGTLVTAAAQPIADDHDHELERTLWVGAGATALALVGGFAWRRLRPASAAASTTTARGVKS